MSTKILCVDDEPHVLAAFERQLRKQFQIETALGGQNGLAAVAANGPFAVIVTDMRMPEMSGLEFLCRVRALSPDSVRMMLTGNNDQQTAISAVNEGNIFRFLTKPCPPATLAAALTAGLEQYRLVTAEKELLEQTLRGSVKVLTEMLSLVNPLAFGRSQRVQRIVARLAAELEIPDAWQLDVAALLSQIGCVTVPEPVLEKVCRGADLARDELAMFARHPQIAGPLIAQIPRLGPVAEIVAYQDKHFDGTGSPADERRGTSIPLGARVLKAALDFEALEFRGHVKTEAVELMKCRSGRYDPAVLAKLETMSRAETQYTRRLIPVGELWAGMILAESLLNAHGMVLVGKGQEITGTLVQRLQNILSPQQLQQSIAVLVAGA